MSELDYSSKLIESLMDRVAKKLGLAPENMTTENLQKIPSEIVDNTIIEIYTTNSDGKPLEDLKSKNPHDVASAVVTKYGKDWREEDYWFVHNSYFVALNNTQKRNFSRNMAMNLVMNARDPNSPFYEKSRKAIQKIVQDDINNYNQKKK